MLAVITNLQRSCQDLCTWTQPHIHRKERAQVCRTKAHSVIKQYLMLEAEVNWVIRCRGLYYITKHIQLNGNVSCVWTAVIAALKTLQEKMRRLELDRVQAERNVQDFTKTVRHQADASAQREADHSTQENHSTQRKGKSVPQQVLVCLNNNQKVQYCIKLVRTKLSLFLLPFRAGFQALFHGNTMLSAGKTARLHEENGGVCTERENHSHRQTGEQTDKSKRACPLYFKSLNFCKFSNEKIQLVYKRKSFWAFKSSLNLFLFLLFSVLIDC